MDFGGQIIGTNDTQRYDMIPYDTFTTVLTTMRLVRPG
jgi:hypothetical protein